MTFPVVLLPGMMCDERLFAPTIARMRSARPMVGRICDHDSIEALAEAVLEAAPPGRFVLGGLSMGGIVAMSVAARAPERVAGLILMDTSHLPESPRRAAAREPQVARARAGDLRGVMIEDMLPLFFGPSAAADEGLRALALDMAERHGPAVFERQSRALATRPDAGPFLANYQGPALVLYGEHDVMCPPARHQDMAALLPRANVAVIRDAGHLPTLEQPAAVAEALDAFCQAVDMSSGGLTPSGMGQT